jgi:hypothetical protein
MCARGGKRATAALVVLVLRREPERLLGKLGCNGRRASIDGEDGSSVEHGGDAGVRRSA